MESFNSDSVKNEVSYIAAIDAARMNIIAMESLSSLAQKKRLFRTAQSSFLDEEANVDTAELICARKRKQIQRMPTINTQNIERKPVVHIEPSILQRAPVMPMSPKSKRIMELEQQCDELLSLMKSRQIEPHPEGIKSRFM